MNTFAKYSLLLAAFVAPMSAFAADATLKTVLKTVMDLVQQATPIAASLALFAFFWGLAMYLFNFGEGKDDKQKQGRALMTYGVLAIFCIVAIFGLVQLLRNTFGINKNANLSVPQIENIYNP